MDMTSFPRSPSWPAAVTPTSSLLKPLPVAPAGFTSGGLPVGIQIVGPYLEDLTPIQFAINLEKEIIGPYKLPPGFDERSKA